MLILALAVHFRERRQRTALDIGAKLANRLKLIRRGELDAVELKAAHATEGVAGIGLNAKAGSTASRANVGVADLRFADGIRVFPEPRPVGEQELLCLCCRHERRARPGTFGPF